jgi:SAM-dependent methyltransferase
MSEAFPQHFPEILETVARYYSDRLRRFGATPGGVDWSTPESQTLRFVQLQTLFDERDDRTLIDYGCGYGALLDHLRLSGRRLRYIGFDISDEMVAAACERHRAAAGASFTSQRSTLSEADYVVASGIFNVKLGHDAGDWRAYVAETLATMNALSTRGFAFNMLTMYSDADKRRDDLYYADPRDVFDLCKRRFSPRVALLHDYPLWEFTIIVRK